MKKFLILTVLTVSIFYLPLTLNACPSCAATMEKGNNSTANQSRIDGYQYSIMMMLSAPLFIVGGFAFYIRRSVKRHQAKKALLNQNN